MSDFNIANLPRITPNFLANMIQNEHENVAIIDVRDSDYIGGHILGGQNVPSNTHDTSMPELVRTLKDKDTVVFHCALSQQRGPSAALRYMREKERLEGKKEKEDDEVNGKEGEKRQKVVVLEGGFVKWQELYGEDKKLTEDYQKDIWEFGY